MQKTIYVKPAEPGAIVRDPANRRPLLAEGAEVPETMFWRRRLMHGDVVEARPPRKPKES